MSSFALPGRTFRNQTPPQSGKPRNIRTTQFFWLDMAVPFTSVAGQNVIANTNLEQFYLRVRGAWSDMTDVRARMFASATGIGLSTLPVPLLSQAGNSDLAFPMLYWRRPFDILPNSSLQGQFTNDGAEAAGVVKNHRAVFGLKASCQKNIVDALIFGP